MDEKKQNEIQSITCPACAGTGLAGGRQCQNCGGIGSGAFYQGRFFYWGLDLDKFSARLRKLRVRFHLALNLLSFVLAVSGILLLGYWLWSASGGGERTEVFYFWKYKHPLLLCFWLSVIADMFVVYRLSEEAARSKKIERVAKDALPPDNWKELKKYPGKVEVSAGYSSEAISVVDDALGLAEQLNNKEIGRLHLFFSSLRVGMVGAIFSRLNVDANVLVDKLKNQLMLIPIAGPGIPPRPSKELKEVLVEAYISALIAGQRRVEAVNLLEPCQEHDENIYEILYSLEVDKDKIKNSLKWFHINEEMIANYKIYKKMAKYKPDSVMDRAYTAVAAPILDHYSYDLTRQAKWGRLEICVSREEEIRDIFDKFESGHAGVILVGDAGVGKNTIVGGIAQLMVKEEVPAIIMDKRLVELDVARLVSGANASEAQERLLRISDEIARSGNIVLYIKNIEQIIGIQAGEGESLDLSEVLLNALENNVFFCIASVNPANYSKYVEGQAIGEKLAKVVISEPENNQAIQILESKIGYLESKYRLYFSYNAIEETVKLSGKYIHDKYLPAKAIDILEAVALDASKTKGKGAIVTKDEVAHIVSRITSIPVEKVSVQEGKKLLNLEEKIHERMIGQEEAVKMVSASLRRARVEMRDGKRPIASFLFMGPTGVGKTELAKTVAEVYFGDEKAMIRVDMSEYQHPDSVHKMIGQGESLGYLTEEVRKAPFSLLLLDEFEKAHPDILNLFLQVMDDGRLTDGQGRTIDFTNTIVIATSNAGALYISEEITKGTDIELIKTSLVNEHLNKVMRPELINRFDGIIVFRPLTETDIASIARLMLRKMEKILDDKGIGLEFSEAGLKEIAKAGFDPKFGARPLRRVIQDRVENVIANKFIAGELQRRDKVKINETGGLDIEKARAL